MCLCFFCYESTKFKIVNLILNLEKPKIAHNPLNNGVTAVLTPFLDFQFFWTFCLENVFWGKNQKLNFKRHQYNKISKIRRKSRRKWLDFLSKICKSSKLFRLFWGDIWFLNFTKLKTAHKSLNNGVRAVLTPFLDFQYFWTFWLENPFFGEKIKNSLNKTISIG